MTLTLTALFLVLSVFGRGDPRAASRPPTVQASRPADGGGGLLPILTEPAAQESPAADPPADLVQASTQTPEQVQRFPGPPLRPSPEHAGRTPDAPAPPPPGAQGPILYVTGNRVNFRAGPSTGDRVIGALDGGAAVEALGPTDTPWVNIRDIDGRIGYISGQFLSSEAPN
ncbi:SH3 domain-containing protein [Paracoccus marinaquae]|nr:SH3 domain-containing protein [Paracoccus marinaquae]